MNHDQMDERFMAARTELEASVYVAPAHYVRVQRAWRRRGWWIYSGILMCALLLIVMVIVLRP